LIHELKRRVLRNPSGVFTAASLYNGILRSYVREGHMATQRTKLQTPAQKANLIYKHLTPIHVALNENLGTTSISLKPSPNGKSLGEQIHVDFGFEDAREDGIITGDADHADIDITNVPSHPCRNHAIL
jgi:hypothetical protein